MRAGNLLFLCAVFAASAMAQPARVDGPTVKVGDVWMYNTLNGWTGELAYVSVNTVKKIGGGDIVMESTSLDRSIVSKILRNRDFNLVRIEAPTFTRSTLPYYPNYAFPLQVGKTWKQEVDFADTRQPDKKIRAKLEGRVVGWESVTVPAGNFLALKIEVKGWYSAPNTGGSWSGRIEDALWYAPEVRNAVRYEYTDTTDSQRYNHEVHELVRYWLIP